MKVCDWTKKDLTSHSGHQLLYACAPYPQQQDNQCSMELCREALEQLVSIWI